MRVGLDAATGGVLTGWDHCVQSIRIILTTRIGSRVMLRDFGSELKSLQDRIPNPQNLMRLYVAIAGALRKWEPGYRLRQLRIVRAGADGVYEIELSGTFYPRGHLGDYSLSEDRSAALALAARGDA